MTRIQERPSVPATRGEQPAPAATGVVSERANNTREVGAPRTGDGLEVGPGPCTDHGGLAERATGLGLGAEAPCSDGRLGVLVASRPFDPAAELCRLGVTSFKDHLPVIDDQLAQARGVSGDSVRLRYPGASPGSGTDLTLVALDQYRPVTSTEPQTLADPKLMRWLQTRDAGTADNFENRDAAAVARFADHYLETHVAELHALGIRDVAALEPRQAASLAGLITTDVMRYNRTAVADDDNVLFHPCVQAALRRLAERDLALASRVASWTPAQPPAHVRDMDRAGIERFVDNAPSDDNPLAEDGVCRNYTEVFQGVWEALKQRQTAGQSRLDNTYVKQPMGDYHIWNALYTVQPDGTLLGTQLDATWADSDGGTADGIERALGSQDFAGAYATARAEFALNDLHLEANGVSKKQLLTDYYTVFLAAHDLAARGQADHGARLLDTFLRDLPETSGRDLRHWSDSFLRDKAPPHRRLPGAEALAGAMQRLDVG